MTFRMYMNTYGIFLSNAKRSLSLIQDSVKPQDENILNATNVIISCSSCVEAFVNKLFQEHTNFKCYDELKLSGKLETLYNLNSKNIDWGRNPYQTFSEIIGVRNWLVHFKSPNIGLMNSDDRWILDKENKAPKKDPFEIFKKEKCETYYSETKKILLDLSELIGLSDFEYEKIKNENLDFFIIG